MILSNDIASGPTGATISDEINQLVIPFYETELKTLKAYIPNLELSIFPSTCKLFSESYLIIYLN